VFLIFCSTLQTGTNTLWPWRASDDRPAGHPKRIYPLDSHHRREHRFVEIPREICMSWKKPTIIQIALGAEINSYACARKK
jgi:coenzyme PQQ precursor peptide PqqA